LITVTAALVMITAVLALPVLLLVGIALGPIALVTLLIVACVAPPFLLAGAILRHSGRS
jgi:hypothetical protein